MLRLFDWPALAMMLCAPVVGMLCMVTKLDDSPKTYLMLAAVSAATLAVLVAWRALARRALPQVWSREMIQVAD